MTKTMLQLHRWLGLIAGLLILVAAGTAIALNHQAWFRRPLAASEGPFAKYVLSTAVDPSDSRRILVGTHDGFFRSPDGGATWEHIALPIRAEQVGAIQFDPRQPGRVYVAVRASGLYRSDDHGERWEAIALPFSPPRGPQLAALALDAEGKLTLTTTAGLYREVVGGWELVGVAPPKPKANRALQLIYDLHDGRFWGTYGVPLTDGVSAALILLVLSGYGLFFGRGIRRRGARGKVSARGAAPRVPWMAAEHRRRAKLKE